VQRDSAAPGWGEFQNSAERQSLDGYVAHPTPLASLRFDERPSPSRGGWSAHHRRCINTIERGLPNGLHSRSTLPPIANAPVIFFGCQP
jgi:hypothetical protein